jgi:hypothetical protein
MDLRKAWHFQPLGAHCPERSVARLRFSQQVAGMLGIGGSGHTAEQGHTRGNMNSREPVQVIPGTGAGCLATCEDSSIPSPDQATHATNVTLNGGRRNQVNVTMTQDGLASSAARPTPAAAREESGWTKATTIWTVIGVLVALAILYVTYHQ